MKNLLKKASSPMSQTRMGFARKKKNKKKQLSGQFWHNKIPFEIFFLPGTKEELHCDLGSFFLQWNNGALGAQRVKSWDNYVCSYPFWQRPFVCTVIFHSENPAPFNVSITKKKNKKKLLKVKKDRSECFPDLNPRINFFWWVTRKFTKMKLTSRL